jgi:PDZ domain-containing protein
MGRILSPGINLQIRTGHTTISLNPTWLVVIPAGLWAIAALYVPIFGAFLDGVETWAVSVLIVLLAGFSLICHTLAHVYAARMVGSNMPSTLALFLFGDAAQAWPACTSAWKEAVVGMAGPLLNALLAGLAYLIWNAQLNVHLNLSMLFLCAFNIWLVVINLTPAFPLDGGRLARAIMWGLVERPAELTRLVVRFGFLIALVMSGWGVFLILQRSRFSPETGAITILFSLLILAALLTQPAWEEDQPAQTVRSILGRPLQALVAGLLILSLLGVASSLLLTNDGLEAPGLALSVEPMVEVSPQHRYAHSGSFILTSVISQAPITAGEWLIGHLRPIVKVVPPASVVPDSTTPQELAKQGFQMLDQSETTAIVVGLRLAGYQTEMVGKGVEVVTIQPDSPAQGRLQSGDVITGLNGKPIRITSELVDQIKAQEPHATVHLTIKRNQREMEVAVPLMPPTAANASPRLGITIDSAGFDVKLPFPVKIVPEKIVGGPSAGLMFTLTVYNSVSPQDLTGGRKIAGTGTINMDGSVGPIGGVEQKVAAAEAAGAEYFLSPVENYENARSVARRIKVVKIATVEQAVEFLHSLPPQCSLCPRTSWLTHAEPRL